MTDDKQKLEPSGIKMFFAFAVGYLFVVWSIDFAVWALDIDLSGVVVLVVIWTMKIAIGWKAGYDTRKYYTARWKEKHGIKQ